jgi:hypothetical protein
VGRPAKHHVSIVLDEDDYLWARLEGFDFNERFSEYLKMIWREVEVASYGLTIKRAPAYERSNDSRGHV